MPYCETAESTEQFLKNVLFEILDYLKARLLPSKFSKNLNTRFAIAGYSECLNFTVTKHSWSRVNPSNIDQII